MGRPGALQLRPVKVHVLAPWCHGHVRAQNLLPGPWSAGSLCLFLLIRGSECSPSPVSVPGLCSSCPPGTQGKGLCPRRGQSKLGPLPLTLLLCLPWGGWGTVTGAGRATRRRPAGVQDGHGGGLLPLGDYRGHRVAGPPGLAGASLGCAGSQGAGLRGS